MLWAASLAWLNNLRVKLDLFQATWSMVTLVLLEAYDSIESCSSYLYQIRLVWWLYPHRYGYTKSESARLVVLVLSEGDLSYGTHKPQSSHSPKPCQVGQTYKVSLSDVLERSSVPFPSPISSNSILHSRDSHTSSLKLEKSSSRTSRLSFHSPLAS